MIYFDNAATTLQKPRSVMRAVENALLTCANPGRSGHEPSMQAAQAVFNCRAAVCDLFSLSEPERVVFTLNATHALNTAIKSVMHGGGHAVISGYEHNSVSRPLHAMADVEYTVAYSELFNPDDALEQIKNAITEDTKCVVLNHMSNVFGYILPVKAVDALCAEKGIHLIIDASQSAGMTEIDMKDFSAVSFVCMPGHKSLYGPQGTGVLVCLNDSNLHTYMEGGTGSNSIDLEQPRFLPDVFESGTLNVPGIAGLTQGIRFVLGQGIREIAGHERRLAKKLAAGLMTIPGITVYYDEENQGGVVSFVPGNMDCDSFTAELSDMGICTRAGLHCSPLAHKSAGTIDTGTVRASFSAFNTLQEVDVFLMKVKRLASE